MSEQEEEFVDETPSGSPMKMIALFGILFVLSNAVWGAVLFMRGDNTAVASEAQDEATRAALDAQDAEARALDVPGPLVALEPFVVNLDEPAGAHYLRVTIKVEIDREETRPHIDGRLVMLRDRFITILSSKRMAELRTQEDKRMLREELLEVARELTGERAVRAVYFTEFLTQ